MTPKLALKVPGRPLLPARWSVPPTPTPCSTPTPSSQRRTRELAPSPPTPAPTRGSKGLGPRPPAQSVGSKGLGPRPPAQSVGSKRLDLQSPTHSVGVRGARPPGQILRATAQLPMATSVRSRRPRGDLVAGPHTTAAPAARFARAENIGRREVVPRTTLTDLDDVSLELSVFQGHFV